MSKLDEIKTAVAVLNDPNHSADELVKAYVTARSRAGVEILIRALAVVEAAKAFGGGWSGPATKTERALAVKLRNALDALEKP